MGTYGRNFHFLQSPQPGDRLGRYVAGASILIGAPVEAGTDVDGNGQRTVTLKTGTVKPIKGKHGILIWEAPSAYLPGFDPMISVPDDLDHCPIGASVQLVSSDDVRIRLRNTEAYVIQGQRTYAARTMVAGLGATPTLAVDDYIGPGDGDDTNGYWAEVAEANAWAVVTAVYDTGELDAQLVF